MRHAIDALTPILGIVGLALAALIAGGFSLLSIILSKEEAVSKFRQKWIDSLRTEISTLIAHAPQIMSHPLIVQSNETVAQAAKEAISQAETQALIYREFREETRNDYVQLNQAATSVKLRLNPEDPEPESILVLQLLRDLDKTFRNPFSVDFSRSVGELLIRPDNTVRRHI